MKTTANFIHRTVILTILFTTFLSGLCFSQPAGMPPCAPSVAPGESACTAAPICDLNGYCGRTLSSYTIDAWQALKSAIITCSTSGFDQLDINNDSYLKFVAASTSITFDVYVYDCKKPVTTKAIQLAVFSATSCSGGPVDVKYCNKQMNQQATPHNVVINNLTPGETYYILIDGYSSQDCAYSFVASSGIAFGITADINQNTTLCAGQSVTVTASGGSGTYSWTGDAGLGASTGTTVIVTPPVTPGIYHYKITSSGSTVGGPTACPTASEYEFWITIQAGNTPVFNQIAPICSGETLSLPITSTNNITGTWSPAISNTQTTTYTFTPATGGCSASSTTMTITVNPVTTPTFTNPGPICTGSALTLPTSSNNTPAITGTWSPAANNTTTTTYTFTPAASQCSNSTQMTVAVDNQITPTFNNIGPICAGQNFTLPTTSQEGINGIWSPAINNTQTTTYTFTPASNPGSCTITSVTMQVVVNPVPVATAQGQEICTGDVAHIILNATTSGTTFSWIAAATNVTGAGNGSGTEINQTLTSSTGGNVVYTITPKVGACSGIPINVTVNVHATLPIAIVPANSSICLGTSLTLTASGAVSYVWSPANNLNTTTGPTVTASPTTTITYTVSGVSASGCTGTGSVTVTVLPAPVAGFIPSVTAGEVPLAVVFQNTSVNATNYSWDFGNGQTNTAAGPNVSTTYNLSGNYEVTLIASNGVCTDTAKAIIVVTTSDILIHVPNVFTPNDDNVNDVFYIGTTNAKTVEVAIFNRWGNVMTRLEKPTDIWDGGDSPTGVYFYKYTITDFADKIYEGQGFFHLEREKYQ